MSRSNYRITSSHELQVVVGGRFCLAIDLPAETLQANPKSSHLPISPQLLFLVLRFSFIRTTYRATYLPVSKLTIDCISCIYILSHT